MFRIYGLIFWIPAVSSAWLLFVSWPELARPRAHVLAFSVALVLQFLCAGVGPLWVVGLTLQSILAVSLAIRSKMSS